MMLVPHDNEGVAQPSYMWLSQGMTHEVVRHEVAHCSMCLAVYVAHRQQEGSMMSVAHRRVP